MRELSLNIMDIVQNSIRAEADLIEISLVKSPEMQILEISVADNGSGMNKEQIENVQSPFFTTRTTRTVGLGVPLFKMACEQTGGSFSISSEPGRGTVVDALFYTDHIDMTPVGDMSETILLLITCNPDIDFVYNSKMEKEITIDTREIRTVLGEDVPLNDPAVTSWIREYLAEQGQ